MRQIWYTLQTTFGMTFAVCFITSIAELIYLGQTGTIAPDKTHVVAMQSHEGTFYVTPLQFDTLIALDFGWGISGVVSVVIHSACRRRVQK